jgi:hypothetical protein
MGWVNTFTKERAGAPSIMLVSWFWQNKNAQLRKSSEQVLRQAQDERQVVDFVRGEPVEPHRKPTCFLNTRDTKK